VVADSQDDRADPATATVAKHSPGLIDARDPVVANAIASRVPSV
jgi:hypothetical protein